MNYLFHSEVIDYEFINSSNPDTILFLHGWGGNKNSFAQTINLLKSKFNILTLTLPTIEPTNLSWQLSDYVNAVCNILKILNLKEVIIICHSFGFRVATLLKNLAKVKKLIATGGAGPKKNSIFKKITQNNGRILLNQPKFKNLFKSIASADYSTLSKTNRETFKNVVNLNTKSMLYFPCPVLLFWGKHDKDTPFWIARKIKKNNKAKLITTNSDHFAYLKENILFNHEVLEFLK